MYFKSVGTRRVFAKNVRYSMPKHTFKQPWLADVDNAPVEGARAVYWLIDNNWKHVGWLMPGVNEK